MEKIKELSKYTIQENATIRDAIAQIDLGGIGIVFVVSDNNHFIGSITDGDVRRGLLEGIQISEPLDKVVNKKSIVGSEDFSNDKLLQIYQDKGIAQIPIVDSEGKLINIRIARKALKKPRFNNRVFLMAGGLGTRLHPLTLDTPKPMIKIKNRPILETIIQKLIECGFSKFTICVNYLSEQISSHFKDGAHLGVEIDYIHEDKRMGTAGALTLYEGNLNEPFVVMNSDIITSLNFGELIKFFEEHESDATICTKEQTFTIPYGVVNCDRENVKGLEEKPESRVFINAGIYVLPPSQIELIPRDTFFDMPSLINKIISEGMKVTTFPIREHWIDVGRHDELDKANEMYEEIFDNQKG